MDRSRIFDTPLRFARADGIVVIYTPAGQRIALSAAAALDSAQALAEAGREAMQQERRAGNVIEVRFDRLRHLPQRRWQAWCAGLRRQPLRRLVAMLLLPVGLALGTALAFGLLMLGWGSAALAAWAPYLPLAGLALALPLVWCAAPLAMSRDERAGRPDGGGALHLAASNEAPR